MLVKSSNLTDSRLANALEKSIMRCHNAQYRCAQMHGQIWCRLRGHEACIGLHSYLGGILFLVNPESKLDNFVTLWYEMANLAAV